MNGAGEARRRPTPQIEGEPPFPISGTQAEWGFPGPSAMSVPFYNLLFNLSLDAAIAFCRRRRVGPFARAEPDAALRMKAMGALARAGFARDVAERALDMAPGDAEERLLASRRG